MRPQIYDPLTVGKYCEARDPYLAYIAYAKGFCDSELIHITNENQMYKHQARYLVKRRRLELWSEVLQGDNLHKRQLIDQVRPSLSSAVAHVQNLTHSCSTGCRYRCPRVDRS